ncbi:hypothetical protein [Marinobacter sp.]|uniref:hypothetical protein n=1 Tax=Marinobacter sp. TaxID=50741 RepID=UPI00384D76E7
MKFPYATVILVAVAIGYMLWDQSRPAMDLSPSRFTDLRANPATQEEVLAFFTQKAKGLCFEKTEGATDSASFDACMEKAEERRAECKQITSRNMPELIDSQAEFREYGLYLMTCLVPMEGAWEKAGQ